MVPNNEPSPVPVYIWNSLGILEMQRRPLCNCINFPQYSPHIYKPILTLERCACVKLWGEYSFLVTQWKPGSALLLVWLLMYFVLIYWQKKMKVRNQTGSKFPSSPSLDGCNGIRLLLSLFSSLSYSSKPSLSLLVNGQLSCCRMISYFV